MKRRVKLKVQRISRQSVITPETPLRTYCVTCKREVDALNRDQATGMLETDADNLDTLVSHGLVHEIEMVNGNKRICKESLFLNPSSVGD